MGCLELLSSTCLATSAAALIIGHDRQDLGPEVAAQRARQERTLLRTALAGGAALLLAWGAAIEAASKVGTVCCGLCLVL